MTLRRVCVFCGSSPGTQPLYADTARALGRELAARGLGLVYGGATVGLMGAIADAALEAGGHVIGVIPRQLVDKELAHQRLDDLRVVETMHERKAAMASLADAFVAMPGGLGTLDETFEILTWLQLGLHRKPCGFLDVDAYFAPLLAFLDHAVTAGFVRAEHRAMVLVERSVPGLLDALSAYAPPATPKWIDGDAVSP